MIEKAKTAVEKKLRKMKMQAIKLEEELIDYEAKIRGKIEAIEKEIEEIENDKDAAVEKEIQRMKKAAKLKAKKLREKLAQIEVEEDEAEDEIRHDPRSFA